MDRIPTIIDIGGFTGISEQGIKTVVELSGLPVTDWTARKEFSKENRPYMHLCGDVPGFPGFLRRDGGNPAGAAEHLFPLYRPRITGI